MALTDAQIEKLTDEYLVEIYQSLERDVIQDIARRVRKTERLTETAELMAKSMAEQGFSSDKILSEVMRTLRADPTYRKTVAENTKAYKKMVGDEIKMTVKAAREAGDTLVAEAGMMAYNNDLSMWKQAGQTLPPASQLSQIVSSFRKDVDGRIRNLTKTTGFKGTQLGTTGVMQAYQKTLDLALIKTATGTFSYDEACKQAVQQLAQSGLRTIDYANGRSYQLDSAVRMSVRTSLNQMAGRITEANCHNSGTDLVIVSQHAGARPSHQDVENKVFSLSGKSREYPAFSDPMPYEGGEGAGYGDAGGICGVFCRHSFYPFWEGISEIPERREYPPVKSGGKTYTYYEATQKQRKMERDIRALKREAYAATGDDKQLIGRKIKAKTAEYHQFSLDTGIRAKDNRLRVVGEAGTLHNQAALKVQKSGVEKGTKKANIARSKEQLEKAANNIRVEAASYSTRPSKWSGNIIVNNNLAAKGILGRKEWTCDISLIDTADDGTIWHEVLHSCSVSYYDPQTYVRNMAIEEGSVEFLKKQICRRNGIETIDAYKDWVDAIQAVNERFHYGTDMEFATELFNIPMTSRYDWLEDKVRSSLQKEGATVKDFDDTIGAIRALQN